MRPTGNLMRQAQYTLHPARCHSRLFPEFINAAYFSQNAPTSRSTPLLPDIFLAVVTEDYINAGNIHSRRARVARSLMSELTSQCTVGGWMYIHDACVSTIDYSFSPLFFPEVGFVSRVMLRAYIEPSRRFIPRLPRHYFFIPFDVNVNFGLLIFRAILRAESDVEFGEEIVPLKCAFTMLRSTFARAIREEIESNLCRRVSSPTVFAGLAR